MEDTQSQIQAWLFYPFTFCFLLITQVLREKEGYYCYEHFDQMLKQSYYLCKTEQKYALCKRIKKERKEQEYARFLFRLAKFLHPHEVLELGSGIGTNVLYISHPYPDLHYTAIETDRSLYQTAHKLLLKAGTEQQVTLINGSWIAETERYLASHASIDWVYCHADERQPLYEIFLSCKPHLHAQSVFLVKAPRANKENMQAWEKMKKDPATIVSIDMYSLGMLFFNPTLTKKKYTLYF